MAATVTMAGAGFDVPVVLDDADAEESGAGAGGEGHQSLATCKLSTACMCGALVTVQDYAEKQWALIQKGS